MKRVGVLLRKDKLRNIQLDRLLNCESLDGLQFIEIDPDVSLEEQGPFDVVLHKFPEFLYCDKSSRAKDRIARLVNYLNARPYVICIDPLSSLERILSRNDQFQYLKNLLKDSKLGNSILVPNFCVLSKPPGNDSCQFPLIFPIICKPNIARGTNEDHNMVLLFNPNRLVHLNYPAFAQQFINHDAKVIKLFVIGSFMHIRELPSIRNFSISECDSPIYFHSHSVSKDGCESPLSGHFQSSDNVPNITSADEAIFQQLVNKIRHDLNIDLFGVDLVRCTSTSTDKSSFRTTSSSDSTPKQFAIVDLNIFPSYKNVPNFTCHLVNLIRSKLALPLNFLVSTTDKIL